MGVTRMLSVPPADTMQFTDSKVLSDPRYFSILRVSTWLMGTPTILPG